MSERLRKFIEDLRNNSLINSFDEAKTKQGIVLPILQCLNWNIFDTDEVSPEHPAGGEVDFSLRINDIDKIFIEVKRVRWKLEQKEKRQLCNYSSFKGVELAILTNGLIWQFYLPQLKCSWEQKKFWTINLKEQNLDNIVSNFSEFLEKGKTRDNEAIRSAETFYEKQKIEKKIQETLPKAWDNIINEPDESLIDSIKLKTKELCNHEPDNERIKEFIENINYQITTKKTEEIQVPLFTADSKESNYEGEKVTKEQLQNSIIKFLYKSGGRVRKKEVENAIYNNFKNIFDSQYYQEKDYNGIPRWQKNTDWAKEGLKHQDLIKRPTKESRGYWELTSKGIELAKQLALQTKER